MPNFSALGQIVRPPTPVIHLPMHTCIQSVTFINIIFTLGQNMIKPNVSSFLVCYYLILTDRFVHFSRKIDDL